MTHAEDASLRPTYRPGTVLRGRLEVVRTIFGGMGEVIVCRDKADARLLVLKTFPDEVFAIPDAKARFIREANTWLQLGQTDLFVRLEGVVEIDNKPFLQMPFCDGGDLRQRLFRGPLAIGDALHVATRVLLALRLLNDIHKVVHRDVKPANVLFGPKGPLLSDLGIVRCLDDVRGARVVLTRDAGRRTNAPTQHGSFVGTLPYASPEQILDSASVGPASDMWSFAIVAIEAVTGSLPFRAHTPEQLVGAILNEESSAWSAIDRVAPPNLSKILSKCLEKRPERRFSTFTELCKAWDDVIRLKGSPARAGWFSTDRRVSIDDGLIGDVWEEDIFPDRSARAKKIINEGDLNRVKEIYSFHALGEYDRVRQAARQLLGSPRQPGTYFHGFLSNTLEARPTLREARDRDPSVRKAFIFLSREMVVGVVGMWMRALIDWLGEHEPDRQSYQAAFDGALQELESLALWIASGEGVEHDLLVHAGQGLVISGNHERGERLLSEIVKGHPDDLRIWYALLVSLTRRGATETAERLIRYLLEQNKDTTGQTWQVFLAAGCSQIGDAEASVRWALLAHQSNQRDLEALYHVCLGLIALGRRPDADQFFRKMMALNPTSLRTRQVGASLGGVNSDGR